MITDISDGGRDGNVGLVSVLWAGCPKNHGSIRKITKRDYVHRHVCPSVCPCETTGLPLEGFS